ncbi:rRNA pseudouridine synthase [Cognatilysobacter bugurensis]|uniref:Dual-specificity RNA pseudouridine synthase RluF n=1 Tax=Cognatilysobacter bugurensis TaxID=543356 RepID=A0A918W633_9GAMM|nr:rRNA pseudouridine synthase [Lysobacter bugurensis]GHA72350.1 RNA-binding protein S4 [Lysobacter bugurensis]
MTEPVRLAQRVSELMHCSRTDAEQYIRNGWVSVDGAVVEAPQHRVAEEVVTVDPQARLDDVEPATVLLNKPPGVDAIQGPNPATSLITPATRWADDPSDIRVLERHFHRLTPLAPLDRDATGLMVLTQDGRVWRRLTEDADEIEHEYLVEVEGDLGPYGLGRLNHGMDYAGRRLAPCKVSWQSEQRLRFAIKGVREGQLQYMCAQVGLRVKSIRRLRIGRIGVGKGPNGAMPPGAWRYLPVGEKF